MNVIVTNVIIKDGKILLIQEAQEKAYKKWWLPAGHLDDGETICDATIREGREETGYDLKLTNLLGIFNGIRSETPVFIVFLSEIIGGEEVINADEILDIKWVPLEEVMDHDIRVPDLMRDILNRVKDDVKYPMEAIGVRNEI
ncbi:MAG: NUDIX domain-containing protein [Candidatus Nomurabacteria bacterium]|jgi:8-oxo-dGTP diphosphatase|nr:NUDIX domain-containing protein [Candidatus Nomurabacteria bacterium]